MAGLADTAPMVPPTPARARDQRITIDDVASVPSALPTPAGAAPSPAAPPTEDCGGGESLLQRRRLAVGAVAGILAVAGCWVLAGLVAKSIAEPEEPTAIAPGSPADAVAWRRLDAEQQAKQEAETEASAADCRKAQPGEPCYRHVLWSMKEGLKQYGPRAYAGLKENSTFEEWQAVLHKDPWAACPRPCGMTVTEPAPAPSEKQAPAAKGEVGGRAVDAAISSTSSSGMGLGWRSTGRVVAQGQWCSAAEPVPGWRLDSCGNGRSQQVKVLTYNLFWWNLFGRRGGNGGSAGHLIQGNSNPRYDVMAFQECEGVGWVLGDAGMMGEYAALTGPHALCIAYRTSSWRLLGQSARNVAEDRSDQWYGTRAGMWVRLQHVETNQILFFINHHGPLPLNSGGRCGGEATAFNILQMIATEAQQGDVIVLVGDFNAGPGSQTLSSLRPRMHALFTGSSFGGVDHILSSCPRTAGMRNLGAGGSDHDALEAVIQL